VVCVAKDAVRSDELRPRSRVMVRLRTLPAKPSCGRLDARGVAVALSAGFLPAHRGGAVQAQQHAAPAAGGAPAQSVQHDRRPGRHGRHLAVRPCKRETLPERTMRFHAGQGAALVQWNMLSDEFTARHLHYRRQSSLVCDAWLAPTCCSRQTQPWALPQVTGRPTPS